MALDVYKDWLGIPEGDRPPHHYDLLRLVQFEDDEEKIRAHYKKLNSHVRKYAAGKYSIESQDLLNELAKAMLCLTDPERKKEYDESLGREFDDEQGTGAQSVEEILVELGHIDKSQAAELAEFAEQRGLSIRDAAVQMRLTDAETATQALARSQGIPYIDLEETFPDDEILDLMPQQVAKRNTILPLFIDNDVLLVACADQPTHELEDELRMRYQVPSRWVLATPRSISQGIVNYYAAAANRNEETSSTTAQSSDSKPSKKPKPEKKVEKTKPSKKRGNELSPDELKEKKQMAFILCGWAFCGSILIDQYILKSYVFPQTWPWHFMLTTISVPLIAFYLLSGMWKK
ncbi:MAG: general secretion pathway protein GspE [Planctomycetes bacterium]|nr:general secretion pathway protein GspE [Planctomycetota bacterium]MCH9727572.1 general secretion pathway protein GspE [Planctomycetota bacterium]MCH9777448.1 general secretion pathway protein GspE [Planctomycetota bacterium]MDF1744858.1 general secretion pathway protein GspE [Gimesia sp.]